MARTLIQYIPEQLQEHQFTIFTDVDKDLENLKSFKNVKVITIPYKGKWDLFNWEQVKLPYFAKKQNIDLLHGTKNSIPYSGNFGKIATIHDLAYYRRPKSFTTLQRQHLKISATICRKKADRIVAVSENTKKDLIEILGINENKINVIYNAIEERFFIKPDSRELEKTIRNYNLPQKFILFVGTIQPRKNIEVLIRAYLELQKEKKYLDMEIVFAGRKGWLYDELMSSLRENPIKNKIRFIGKVTDEVLIHLYHLANIFAYPSDYDGFGLVPLEAMAAGTPVITSNISSIPEVVGEAAIKVNPRDAKAITKAIKMLYNDNDLYQRLVLKGPEQSRLFNVERQVKGYKNLYSELLSNK